MTATSSPSWWQRCWANRKAIAAAIGAALVFACPLLPPQAQLPCRAIKGGVQLLGQLGGDGSSSDPSTSAPEPSSPAGCSENQVQSGPGVPFCRCRGGVWTDYFDAGAPCED